MHVAPQTLGGGCGGTPRGPGYLQGYMNITLLNIDSMRLQDRFKYDPDLEGLEGIYESFGTDSFLIDSECVLVADQIITTGDTFFLIERDWSKKLGVTFVKLLDCFYYVDKFYLLVVDTVSDEVKLLNHTLLNGITTCTWKIVDTFSIEMMMDKKYNR
jgi:hypothetical protein